MKYNKSLTATVYIVKDDRVLLHIHKKYNTWFPVGGHFEPEELPHEAALREVREETGLDVKLVPRSFHSNDVGLVEKVPMPFCIYHEGDVTERFLDFIYIAKTDSDNLCPENGESSRFRWFSAQELERADIKIHIKNTALAVLKYLEIKTT